ncbi:MAG: hypothetical protein IPN29_02770 [Saprospiraceae bacterium]|nr:hypothetical protein [Saprospiraceae bacterium]
MKLLKQYDRVYPLQKEAETLILLKEPTLHAAIEAAGRIIIPIPGGYQCCLPEDILYLKAESNYTEINFADGSKNIVQNAESNKGIPAA